MANKNEKIELAIHEVDRVVEHAKAIRSHESASPELKRKCRTFLKSSKVKRMASAWNILEMTASETKTEDPGDLMDCSTEEICSMLGSSGQATTSKPQATTSKPQATTSKPKAKPAAKAQQKPAEAPEPPTEPPTKYSAPVQKTVTPSKSLNDLLKQNDGRHVGDICGWHLQGERSIDDVAQAAEKWGLMDDFQFPKQSPNSCYRKTVAEMFQRGRVDDREYSAVLVEDSPDRIVHSIVVKTIIDDHGNEVSEKDAAFQTEMKVGFDKAAYASGASPGNCVKLPNPDDPTAERFMQVYLDMATKYVTSDLRNGIRAAFKNWDALNVLPQNSFFFVPAGYAEKVRAWHGFMKDISQTVAILPQFDTTETIESLRQSARNGIESQIQEVMGFLDQHTAGKVRSKTLEHRVRDLDEITARAELYERLLGGTLKDLREKMSTAREAVIKDITNVKDREERDREEAKAAQKEKDRLYREKQKAEREAKKKADKKDEQAPVAATA